MAPIKAESGRYDSPRHHCYGADWVGYGLDSAFEPWCWDGTAVWRGPLCNTRSEALALAKNHAESCST